MIYQFGNYKLDTERYLLSQSSNPVPVEPLVFNILVYLIEHRRRVVSREELLTELWVGKVVTDSALGARLKDARKAINDSGRRQAVIRTFHGRGYQFIAEVSESASLSDEGKLPAQSVNPSIPDKPSIAVLPFSNFNHSNEQAYLSDGITEDIITSLSQFHDLFVIARNSSFLYKDQSVGMSQIARELGVRYLLEGSIQRASRRIRINVQLTDSDTMGHIWSERYDRTIEDIFELQDEITHCIVGNIAPQIEIAEVERARKLSSDNLTAYELALKAQSRSYEACRSDKLDLHNEVVGLAEKALEIDPHCSHAMWALCFYYANVYLFQRGADPENYLSLSWEVAEQFVKNDGSNPKAYISRGLVHQYRGDHEAALADYRHAYGLNPNFALNLFILAYGESLAGFTTDAIAHAQQALRLSPRETGFWRGDACLTMTQAYFADAEFENAKICAQQAIQMGTKAPTRRALMVACCAYTEDISSINKHLQELNSFAPNFIPNILTGKMKLYKRTEHNHLLIEGLGIALKHFEKS